MSEKNSQVAFVGGLDLTGGRWDTPCHELYSTLLDEHLDDFRNSNAKTVPAEQGPRQPWHDIHCRLVLQIFSIQILCEAPGLGLINRVWS